VTDAGRPDARAALDPLLRLDLAAWAGLPRLVVADLVAAFGPPARDEEARLGSYPARRLGWDVEGPSGGLDAFVRAEGVVMVATRHAPPPEAAPALLAALGEPCAVLPQEVRAVGAYVHEHLYCARGLVLGVSVPHGAGGPSGIVRCRGIRPIASREEFGAELYQPADQRITWPSPGV
jgi:hypothetical protein